MKFTIPVIPLPRFFFTAVLKALTVIGAASFCRMSSTMSRKFEACGGRVVLRFVVLGLAACPFPFPFAWARVLIAALSVVGSCARALLLRSSRSAAKVSRMLAALRSCTAARASSFS